MLSLHEDDEYPLELDVDATPYAIPFQVRFEAGQRRLFDASPTSDECDHSASWRRLPLLMRTSTLSRPP